MARQWAGKGEKKRIMCQDMLWHRIWINIYAPNNWWKSSTAAGIGIRCNDLRVLFYFLNGECGSSKKLTQKMNFHRGNPRGQRQFSGLVATWHNRPVYWTHASVFIREGIYQDFPSSVAKKSRAALDFQACTETAACWYVNYEYIIMYKA